MTLGEKLKDLRIDKGMSQEDVAAQAGISRRSYIMYEQDESIPKKKETFEKLAEVFGCDADELSIYKEAASLNGAAAALSVLGSVLGTAALPMWSVLPGASIAALAVGNASKNVSTIIRKTTQNQLENASQQYSNDMLLKYEKRQRRFQATATGVIYSKLASDGISFTPGNKADLDTLGGAPDEYITVHGSTDYEWWFSFWAKDEELDKNVIMSEKDRAAFMISRYATAKFDEDRKVSIVVDDESLYDAVLNYSNHNSFHGNMSVMLVDSDSVTVIKEGVVSIV